MAKKSQAALSAEAVARMMTAQDQGEQNDEGQVDSVREEAAEPGSMVEAVQPRSQMRTVRSYDASFDPGKIDGRTLRKTGREPFATRIKPETHEALRRIAYANGITIAEALERAVAAYNA